MKMYLSLMGMGIAVILMTVTPAVAQWNNMGSYLYTTDNVTIGANSTSRQLFITGDNSVVRLDRSQNSPGFMIVRTQAGVGPLKTFLCGVTAWGQDEGRFVIEDLHQNTSGSGDVRLAIDENGDVGIGTTTPQFRLHVSGGDMALENNEHLYFQNSSGLYYASIELDTDDDLEISNITGDIHLSVATATSFSVLTDFTVWNRSLDNSLNGTVYHNDGVLTATDPSSRDYKKDIQPIDLRAERVLQLEPKSFNWKDGHKDFGYIAEEVAEAIPELYRNDGKTKGFVSDKLPVYIIEVLKDQQNQIAELRSKIKTLQARLEAGK